MKLVRKGSFLTAWVITLLISSMIGSAEVVYAQPDGAVKEQSAKIKIQGEENRFYGLDRYKTALRIAEEVNNGQTENVILASGENYPDALAASVLAFKLKAPILLVDTSAASTVEAFDYIRKHLTSSGTIYLSGGPGVIGADFTEQLKQMGYSDQHLVQLGGGDRYETSVRLAEKIDVAQGTTLVLVTGNDFQDALTISSFAAQKGWPMLLVGEELSPSVEQYVQQIQPEKIILAGGIASIPSTLEVRLGALFPKTKLERIGGDNANSTEQKILEAFASNPNKIYVASATVFADALSGSILAAQNGAPIILVDDVSFKPSNPVIKYLKTLKNPRLFAFGGEGAISAPLFAMIRLSIDPENAQNQGSAVLNLIEIPGVGLMHQYQMNDNLTVEANLNMDFMFTMAALGNGLNHKGYPVDPNRSEINRRIRDYFSKYLGNTMVKQFYELEARNSSSGPSEKFDGSATLAMLRTGGFMNGQLFNPQDKEFLNRTMFMKDRLTLEELVNRLRAFAEETKAQEFYKTNIDLYNRMVDDFVKETLSFNHVERIHNFYGIDLSKNQFKVILTTVENGGSAFYIDNGDGTKTYYNDMDPMGDLESKLNVLYHETAHNYYSAIRTREFQNLVDQYSTYKENLGCYSPEDDFSRRLNETLARVTTVIMLKQYHGQAIAQQNMSQEMRLGWKNLDKLSAFVEEKYLNNRMVYPSFDKFVPEILEYIKTLS